MVPRILSRKHENKLREREWENWPETARVPRKCQVQSLVMRVIDSPAGMALLAQKFFLALMLTVGGGRVKSRSPLFPGTGERVQDCSVVFSPASSNRPRGAPLRREGQRPLVGWGRREA
jgi:hypothetical protein